ncbi:MAG: hypothetical protein GY803_10460 [Chloroflexi bacterium]|nr:hypothetical protein [Chloroflexota bacterium]
MTDTVALLPIGAKVLIDGEDITGTIVSISISGEKMSVFYTVEWWDDRSLNSGSFFPSQIEPQDDEVERMTFGFSSSHGRNNE